MAGTQVFPTPQATGGGAGTPASSVVSEQSFGQSPVAGVSTDYARGDHSHGTPPNPGWTDGGAVAYLTTGTDTVTVGASAASVANRKLTVANTGTNLGVRVTPLAATDNVLDVALAADANARFAVDANGAHTWGPASTAVDVRLRRASAGTLIIDNNAGGSAVLSVLGSTVVQRLSVQQVTTAASPYAVSLIDCVVFANPGGAQTINLPIASGSLAGRLITVKRINNSANVVTVGSLGGTIDGAATYVLAAGSYASATFTTDGTNWWVI